MTLCVYVFDAIVQFCQLNLKSYTFNIARGFLKIALFTSNTYKLYRVSILQGVAKKLCHTLVPLPRTELFHTLHCQCAFQELEEGFFRYSQRLRVDHTSDDGQSRVGFA